MAEFDAHSTIEDAVNAAAKGLVKRSADGQGHDVEYYSLKDLLEAERVRAGRVAAGKKHFGLRMVKLIPPGTG